MKLFSRDISPFASRVRASIIAKKLPIEIINDPDTRSVEFGQINPLRQVPVLVFDDGNALPESDTIVEFLEDAFPDIALRPADPRARARVRLLARIAEQNVFPAATQIFMARAGGDAQQIDLLFSKLDAALATLAGFLDDNRAGWRAYGSQLTTADAALAPFLFFVHMLDQTSGHKLLGKHARLEQFWEGARADATLSVVIRQMAHGMALMRQRAPG